MEERFKTTAFGGYDKDDVQQELQKLRDNSYAEKKQLTNEMEQIRRELEQKKSLLAEKDQKIYELQSALIAKDQELLEKDRQIREKYQSYIDNYETIGSLIYESKIRAKQVDREAESTRQRILEEAEAEAARIREEAKADAAKTLEDTQRQIDERNREGTLKYDAIQEELSHVLESFNKVQKQFMNSYRDIQRIMNEGDAAVSADPYLTDDNLDHFITDED